MAEIDELLSTYAGTAFVRQAAFADYLGERSWNLDTQNGIVTFGEDLQFSVQILGTHSEADNSWLWAWANEDSGLPDSVISTSLEMKALGDANGIEHFSTGHFTLDCDASQLALICSGVSNCCYYMGPYEGGAVFFLIVNTPPDILSPLNNELTAAKIAEVISIFKVDHHTHAVSFLTQQGYEVTEEGRRVIGLRGLDKINIDLDSLGRITNVITGDPEPEAAVQKDPTIPPQFGKIKKLGDEKKPEPQPAADSTAQAAGDAPLQPAAGAFSMQSASGDGPPQPAAGAFSMQSVAGDAPAPSSGGSPLKLKKDDRTSAHDEYKDRAEKTSAKFDEYFEQEAKNEAGFFEKLFRVGNTFSDKARKIIIGVAAVLFIFGLVLSFKTILMNLAFAALTFVAVRVISMQQGVLNRLGLFPGRLMISGFFSILFIFVAIFYRVWQDQGGQYIENIQHVEQLANKSQEAIKGAVGDAVKSIEENTGAETNMETGEMATHQFKYSDKMANSFHDATHLTGGGLLKMYLQYVFLLFSFTLLPFIKERELIKVNYLRPDNEEFGWKVSRYFLVRIVKSSIITLIFIIGLKASGCESVIFIAGITFALGLVSRFGPVIGLAMCIPVIITQFKAGTGFQAMIGLAITGAIAVVAESKIHWLIMMLPIKNKQAYIPPVLAKKKQVVKVESGGSSIGKLIGLTSFLATIAFYGLVAFAGWKAYSVWNDFDATRKKVETSVKSGDVSTIKEAHENNPYDRSFLLALTKACLKSGELEDMVKYADKYRDFKMPESGGSGLMNKGEHFIRRFLSKSGKADKDKDAYEWILKNFAEKKPNLLPKKELFQVIISLQKLDEDNLHMYHTAGQHFMAKKNYFDVREWCNKGLTFHKDDLPLMKLIVRSYIGDKNKSAANNALLNIAKAKFHDEEVNQLQLEVNKL